MRNADLGFGAREVEYISSMITSTVLGNSLRGFKPAGWKNRPFSKDLPLECDISGEHELLSWSIQSQTLTYQKINSSIKGPVESRCLLISANLSDIT